MSRYHIEIVGGTCHVCLSNHFGSMCNGCGALVCGCRPGICPSEEYHDEQERYLYEKQRDEREAMDERHYRERGDR